MKCAAILIAIVTIAGCEAASPRNTPVIESAQSQPAPAQPHVEKTYAGQGTLSVWITPDGQIRYENWSLTLADVPYFVKEKHPDIIKIHTSPNSVVEFSKGEAVKKAFESAGVPHIYFASNTDLN